SDVVIRDPQTWEPQPTGIPGLIEVVSTLPWSYPGHVLLTDDVGVVDSVDDGERPGKRFRVLGRLPRAEPRGCSDTFATTTPTGCGFPAGWSSTSHRPTSTPSSCTPGRCPHWPATATS